MKAYITVKLGNGTYKNVDFENIEYIFVSIDGEKTVFFDCDDKMEYGVQVEKESE